MRHIETCFSPALFSLFNSRDANVVVIDVMRATTSICAALEAGATAIIPVGSVDEARAIKNAGYVLAAERDGKVLDFADFGNSPDLFTPERVGGKVIAYSTTNGTQAIRVAEGAKHIIIGAFVNISVVVDFLQKNDAPVLLFCSGWKNRFNLEDSLCAGAIAERLISSGGYSTNCDSTLAAIDLWHEASGNIMQYIEKASHRHRLRGLVPDAVVEYCHTPDLLHVLPVVQNNLIRNILAKTIN